LLDSGVTAEVVLWCQRVIAVDPCWEEACRLLMRGHMADGNRPQALRVYNRCRAVLAQELGLEPMIEPHRIHDQILSDRGRNGRIIWLGY
jgi:DNA-binding SARP family transcriptional activator